jgi:hypothetical protein
MAGYQIGQTVADECEQLMIGQGPDHGQDVAA